MGSVLVGHYQKIGGFIRMWSVLGYEAERYPQKGSTEMKHLRAEMKDGQFHRFKKIMNAMELHTNDETIVCLMDEYETPPTVEEAKDVLEQEGYEVVEKNE